MQEESGIHDRLFREKPQLNLDRKMSDFFVLAVQNGRQYW